MSGDAYFPVKIATTVDGAMSLANRRLYALGVGTSGSVFQAVGPGSSSIVKGYREILAARTIYSPMTTKRDEDLLILKLLGANECAQQSGFKFPKPSKIVLQLKGVGDIEGIEFSDHVVGRTVLDLKHDPAVTGEVRNYVLQEYEQRLARLGACLKAHFDSSEQTSMAGFYKGLNNKPVFEMPFLLHQATFHHGTAMMWTQVFIKADGVVVDPKNLDLYLVDAT